jgi:FAD dependent oxidoreductase
MRRAPGCHFGLIWVSGRRPGAELALALRARELWEEIAAGAPGTGFRPAGSVTLAASEAELRLLKEASALPDARERGFELLDPAAVRAVNPALRGEYAGGLFCSADAIAEPRQTLPALRTSLAGPRYRWLPGLEAAEIAPHAVRDHTGTWHGGDLVILCTGANRTGIAGAPPGVRRVRLQMRTPMTTSAPAPRPCWARRYLGFSAAGPGFTVRLSATTLTVRPVKARSITGPQSRPA